MRNTHRIVLVSLALAAGCASAHDAAPVVALQKEAAAALASRCAQDHAALRASIAAILDVRRAALRTRLEARALRLRYSNEANPTIGGLSGDEARAWLDEHAAASEADALINRLPALASYDEDAQLALDALDRRAADTAALFADLLASTTLMESYTSEAETYEAAEPRRVLAELYTQALRERIDDPDKQAAADRIADLLLTEPSR